MDIPILKYLDILIGLAVVMVLGTTVVAAATQLLLSSLYFRSRSLRMGIEELIRDLDPSEITPQDARKIAETILRHPVLARPSGVVGKALNWVHNLDRGRRKLAPLPSSNPTDVIQRSELVMLLMEWAAGEGAMVKAETTPQEIKDKLLKVLRTLGISNPADVLKEVRLKAIENERADPKLPAHVWWSSALAEKAASNLVGKINQNFDNAMARVTQAFKLKANSVACVVSFVVAFSIQLDSLSLLKRLSVDDKLRDSLVKEAEMLTDRIQKVQSEARAQAEKKDAPDEEARAKQEAEKARAAREEIDSTLALMREPRFSVIPDTLYWEKLAQGKACPDTTRAASGAWNGTLQVGERTFALAAQQPLNVETLESAVAATRAPVYLYRIENGRKCLLLAARSPAVSPASLKLAAAEGSVALQLEDVILDRDKEGARRRFPGVLLSWVLLSLGTPFWFNLLKNLLGLRSTLARKEDKERSDRENPIEPPKPKVPEAAAATAPKTPGASG